MKYSLFMPANAGTDMAAANMAMTFFISIFFLYCPYLSFSLSVLEAVLNFSEDSFICLSTLLPLKGNRTHYYP